MRRARKKRQLTASERRALASVGLTVVSYQPDGERAQIRQLGPEPDARRSSLLINGDRGEGSR